MAPLEKKGRQLDLSKLFPQYWLLYVAFLKTKTKINQPMKKTLQSKQNIKAIRCLFFSEYLILVYFDTDL